MSVSHPIPLPQPPPGILYLRSESDVLERRELDAYQHLLLRAWRKLKLSGVFVIRGIPTVYLREDETALASNEICDLQKLFWNQGVATLLVLIDPKKTRVFSGMVPPQDVSSSAPTDAEKLNCFVAELNIAGQALRAHRNNNHDGALDAYNLFCRQVVSGRFYQKYRTAEKSGPNKFDSGSMVDSYLLKQLENVRKELTCGPQKLSVEIAHAFLGRLLFTCYLVDREIVSLQDSKYFPKHQWSKLQQVLEGDDTEVLGRLYNKLFPQLKKDFNGSMFDDGGTQQEREAIRPEHLSAIRQFFGAHDVATKQQSLGFWPYDFSFIPVETISAIYENFLAKEGGKKKREDGAFYTPRFLAEMTLDLAMEGRQGLKGKRFLDPSCGSGIFLVLIFNRMAAEWTAANPKKANSTSASAFKAKDKALRDALSSLRGVDINLTACRIACFSLYLAFLDQFEPRDIRSYIQQSDTNKLPNLLRYKGGKGNKPDTIPVIWEGDFFLLAKDWESEPKERFDFIVGNPPWVRLGSLYLEQEFMKQTPILLRNDGKAALLLPTKVFFNKTDVFQDQWLRQVTLEKVIQLSDYRFILFLNAVCPCLIARYTSSPPPIETHRVEYLTPKVDRVDLRQGAIPIAPTDRKEIPLRVLLGACTQKAASMAWKSHFWGTPRDLKFLNHLFALPRLSDRVDQLSVKGNEREHDWVVGQGAKPWSANPTKEPDRTLRPFNEQGDEWTPNDAFVSPKELKSLCYLPVEISEQIGKHFTSKKKSITHLYSKPPPELFSPPLVLFNQGFTQASFFNYRVRFQHTLQSIAGPPRNEDQLIFLAAFLRSRLARYFVFHTSSNIGMERDKAHLDEVLNLPFFLPGDAYAASPNAPALLKKIVKKFKLLQKQMNDDARSLQAKDDPTTFRLKHSNEGTPEQERKKWRSKWAVKTAKVQDEIEPLIYEYFGLNSQEQALVEDTHHVFDTSDTPGSLETSMPTLEPIHSDGLEAYANTLENTLTEWSLSKALTTSLVGSVNEELGLAILRIEQTKKKGGFKAELLSSELAEAVKRIEEAATTSNGTLIYLRDETWWFDGPIITIAKPALRGRWTRTAAINDAAEIYATIQQSRQVGA